MTALRTIVPWLALPLSLAACAEPRGGTGVGGAYHDTAETWAEFGSLAERFPERAQTFSVGLTVEGREIPGLSISDRIAGSEGKPNIYVVGGVHGGEWIGVEVPIGFAHYLLEGAAGDPVARRAMREARFWIIPILNPDGHEFAMHSNRFWRKNRRYNGDGSWGVDLNRNYPRGWGCDPARAVTTDLEYEGPSPFSEPETQAVRDFMQAHRPAGGLEYHSYGQIIYTALPDRITARDIALATVIAPEMARLMRAVHGRVYATPSSNGHYEIGAVPDPSQCGGLGHLQGWARSTFGAAACLIELPQPTYLEGGHFVPESDIEGIVAEQIPAIVRFADFTLHGS